MLDPIADKLLVNALLIVLAFTGDFDGWDLIPAIAIMLRETLVPGLREYLGNARIEVPVTLLAKWKTTTQLIALARRHPRRPLSPASASSPTSSSGSRRP